MTAHSKIKSKNKGIGLLAFVSSLIISASLLAAALFLSEEISRFVTRGLEICVRSIIPSVFPFLVTTDLLIRFVKFEKVAFLRRGFERIFRISGAALSVFVCGILSGFPTGAKLSLTLYENGKISKSECERLMGISSNASPGYIICAIGGGMLKSIRLGIALFFITSCSAVLSGAVLGINSNFSKEFDFDLGQKYSFSDSVKSAALACLNICAFVTFFSLLCGLLETYIKSEGVILLILPFLEIGAATSYISDLYIFNPFLSFPLIAFSVSFSGICVYAQIKSLITKPTISMKPYIYAKLLQGIFSALLSAILFPTFFRF